MPALYGGEALTKSSKSRIRELLKQAGSSQKSLERLIRHPEKFAKEAGLSEAEAASLRGADLVIAVTQNPLAGLGSLNLQTTRPITITAIHNQLTSGDPPSLDELDKAELLKVLRKALDSPEYSAQLRKTLNLKR